MNIEKQICDSTEKIAYFMADITTKDNMKIQKLVDAICNIQATISTRILVSKAVESNAHLEG
jgi:hypothetical protein